MKEIYLVINKLWRISGVISLNKSTCLIIFLNPMPTNEQRKFEKYTLCHFLVDNLKLWWWRIMPINRHTYKYSICHKTDFCDWRKKPILYMNQELKEDLTIHYRTLGTNYSKNKIFRIHWKTYKANGGWKYMRSGNLPLVFLFSVLAEPWANLCAGKSSNEIRTCDRFGCGHYRASRYFYHMLSGLLTSLLSVLALCFLKCTWSFPLTTRKLGDETSYMTVFGATSKNFASSMGSKLGVWNKGKRKGSKQCFPMVTYFTWFFQGENQASLFHFIDEELELEAPKG